MTDFACGESERSSRPVSLLRKAARYRREHVRAVRSSEMTCALCRRSGVLIPAMEGGARARDKMTSYLATREEERRGPGVRPAGIYVGRQLGRGDAISGGDLSV